MSGLSLDEITTHLLYEFRRKVLSQKVLHVKSPLRVADQLNRSLAVTHHPLVVATARQQIALQDGPAVTAEQGLQPVPFLQVQRAVAELVLRLVQAGVDWLRWLVWRLVCHQSFRASQIH